MFTMYAEKIVTHFLNNTIFTGSDFLFAFAYCVKNLNQNNRNHSTYNHDKTSQFPSYFEKAKK